MTEELQDTSVEEALAEGEPQEELAEETQEQEQSTLNDADFEKIDQRQQSWMGRKFKEFEDKMAGVLQSTQQEFVNQVAPVTQGNNVIDEFQERLSDKSLGGDFLGAVDDAMRVINTRQKNMSNQATIEIDKAITGYSKDPMYKEIYSDVKKRAHEYGKTMPHQVATRLAFTEAKMNHYESANTGGSNLAIQGDGARTPQQKKTKLAPEFKKACERGIADGTFTDEQDYINNLAPNIREKYGMKG